MSKLGGGTKIYAQMEHWGSRNGLAGRIEGVMAGNKRLQDEVGVFLPATDLQREPERVETWQPESDLGPICRQPAQQPKGSSLRPSRNNLAQPYTRS